MKKSPTFVVLGATLFLLYIGINTAPPLFEFYRRRFGVTTDELSLLFSLYALGTVVALPLCGSASDRFGRTGIIVGGLLCNTAGSLLLAIGGEFQVLLAGRVLQGISVAAISAPAMAALIELAPEQRPGLAATVATLALPVGATIGVLASAIGAEWTPWPQAFGMMVPVVLSAMLVPFLLFGAKPGAAAAAHTWQGEADRSRWNDLPADFWVSCAIIFYACAIQVTVFAIAGPRLAEVLPSHPYLGAATGMAVFLLMSVLGQTIWERSVLQDRAVGPIVLIALSEWALQQSLAEADLWVSGLTIALCGFAYGALAITAQRAVNAAAPVQHRGLAASIFMSIRYVGAAIPVFGIGVYARDHGVAGALEFFALLTLTMGASLLMMIGVVRLRKVKSSAGPDLTRESTDTTGSWDMELSHEGTAGSASPRALSALARQ